MNQVTAAEVRQSYEAIYERHGIRDHLVFYRWILRLLRPAPGCALLDVACG